MAIHVKFNPPADAIDPGIYLVRVDAIGLQPNSKYEGTLRWTFTIIDGRVPQYANKQIYGMSSSNPSPKSKLFAWLKAFGIAMELGQTFDLEALIGRSIIATVENSTSVTNGHEVTYSNVKDLIPANAMPVPLDTPQQATPAPVQVQQPVQQPAPRPATAAQQPAIPAASTPLVPGNKLAADEDLYSF